MNDKIKVALIIICQLFALLSSAGCKNNRYINIPTNIHPNSNVDLVNCSQYYADKKREACSYIGDDDLFELHTSDRNQDISAYYKQNRLYVSVENPNGETDTVVKTTTGINIVYIDFAILNDYQLLALASDSMGNTLVINIKEGITSEYIGVVADGTISTIKSCDKGFLLIGDNSLILYDESMNVKNNYRSDSAILGATTIGDTLFTVETDNVAQTESVQQKDFIYSYQFRCKAIELATMKVNTESLLCQHSNIEASYRHLGDADVMALDNERLLLSLYEGIYEVNIFDGDVGTILNTYDYGAISSACFISCDELLKIHLSYFDIIEEQCVDVISTVMRGEFEKTRIVAGILGSVDCEELFQYVNRGKNDIYICLDKVGNDGFETTDYINMMTNESFDLLVFDDKLRDVLVQGDYLLDLNTSDLDKGKLSKNTSGLMDFYIFPNYSIKAYLYNTKYWNDDTSKYLFDHDDANEIFANQTVRKIVDEYYGIIQQDIEENGQVSVNIVSDLLELCSQFNMDYYESQPLFFEIKDGKLIYNAVDVGSVEQLYSFYCNYPDCLGYCAPWGYDSIAINPDYYIGVSTGSSYINECVSVLDMLLEEEVQIHLSFPVNSNAQSIQVNSFVESLDKDSAGRIISEYPVLSDEEMKNLSQYYDEITRDMINGTHKENNDTEYEYYNVVPLLDNNSLYEYRIMAMSFITDAHEIYGVNDAVLKILIEEVNSFLNESKDADQAAEVICNRINLYIAETGN